MVRKINLPESCVFSDYFKLNAYPEEILGYFGYEFATTELILPKTASLPIDVEALQTRFHKFLPFIPADNEAARREFLIAPVLLELAIATKTRLRVNYTVEVSPQLRGSIDYFLQANDRLLVIEAKDENLERGFKQLAVELIAVAQENCDTLAANHLLWGAVSIGKIWQFSVLDTKRLIVTQDLNMYRVPNDLEVLLQGLVGILASS